VPGPGDDIGLLQRSTGDMLALNSAARTAISIQLRIIKGAPDSSAVGQWNRQFEAEGLPRFVTRFGIHVGDAVVGMSGRPSGWTTRCWAAA
jgi:hypothetical protein